MLSRASLLGELESAIASGSNDKRHSMLRRITDLFLYGAEQLTDDQIALFDEVLGRLAEDTETKARAELSRRLAPIGNAPVETVRTLARADEIDVASPVLTESARLNEKDLIEAAKRGGQSHLLAISKRQELSESITDVLVNRGNRDVVRSVAQNNGARFSNAGFGTLVEKSVGDDVLGETVGLRKDVPTQHLKMLLVKASDKVTKRLTEASAGASPNLQKALAELAAGASTKPEPPAAEPPKKGAVLDDKVIHDFARAGKVDETATALSAICRIPVAEVKRAMQASDTAMIVMIIRASGLSWSTAKAILLMPTSRHSPAPQDLDKTEKHFERLNVSTALRVVRFRASGSGSGSA
jgi:Uncharacterised protein conserved in bacteria (DUF2336)